MKHGQSPLLTREQFKVQVFGRDKHTCVFCNQPAVDAHHILDRKLWNDGGYYLNNGASVCEAHHLACEYTHVSVPEVWKACHITDGAVPVYMSKDLEWDKWGNPVAASGRRLRGPMFFDENVQKALEKGNKLSLFSPGVVLPILQNLSRADLLTYKFLHADREVALYTTTFEALRHHSHCLSLTEELCPLSSLEAALPQDWSMTGPLLWNEHTECLNAHDTHEWMQLIGHPAWTPLHYGLLSKVDLLALPPLDPGACYFIRCAMEIPLKLAHHLCATFQ